MAFEDHGAASSGVELGHEIVRGALELAGAAELAEATEAGELVVAARPPKGTSARLPGKRRREA
jgi:hypothetical protein